MESLRDFPDNNSNLMGFHLVLQNDTVALILLGNLILLNKEHILVSRLDSSTFYHITVCNDQKCVMLANASFSRALPSSLRVWLEYLAV